MLSDLQNLVELQIADKEILRLKEEIAALPKRVAVIEEKLAKTRAKLEKAKATAKADEAARKKHETAIADLQSKISKYRDQSLDVKTNDQYKALLHEIQFAEQEIRANEDKILDLMVNAEARDKDVKAAEGELKAETAEIENEKAQARERTAEDEKQLAEWGGKREKLRGGVNPDTLRHYERVMKFRGSGLSEVRDQQCMTCRVRLRPQTYNEVRTGNTIIECESCQRILYFNPENEATIERTNFTTKRRARPKIDSQQAWFYHPSYGETGEAFLAFVNGSSNSTRRVYELHTGRQFGDIVQREGSFRLAFPEDLNGVIRLNGNWDQEEIDGWGAELPMVVLDSLISDLAAARAESRHSSHAAASGSASSEHPAAS
ncbi:MAG TPA: C4-type zinc ribbon domain-containing protein [Terriglobales bacterium]|nr:C4-type zinc ribbon domain-containing protein [Terriglobales bacterium]